MGGLGIEGCHVVYLNSVEVGPFVVLVVRAEGDAVQHLEVLEHLLVFVEKRCRVELRAELALQDFRELVVLGLFICIFWLCLEKG